MNRLLLPKFVVLLVVVVLIVRLYQLQLVPTEAEQYRYTTGELTTRYLPLRPLRGEVLANDGRTLLAESVPIFTVAVRLADLDQAAPRGSERRAEIFAQLSQVLGVTSTLTISPSSALDHDPALRSDLQQGLGVAALRSIEQRSLPDPIQIEYTAAHHAAVRALVERYRPVVQVAGPTAPAAAEVVPAALAVPISGTITISPATQLAADAELRNELHQLFGPTTVEAAPAAQPHSWLTVDVPPEQSTIALRISRAYSDVLTLENPLEQQVDQANIPGYQPLVLKRDIPRDVALVLRENASSLPGIVVEQDYRRRYPYSNAVPSLSHLLGYIGRINECELVSRNPARSWVSGMLDSIGHAIECGVIQKQINPYQLGIPRYLLEDRLGKDGIEASYEERLRGELGIQKIVVDALGRPVHAPEVVQPARDGDNVVLTIDIAFQRQVEQILRTWIAEGEARRQVQDGPFAYKREYDEITSGVAIVVEIDTGRILAMASWPAYDNNIWVDPARSGELHALLAPPPERAEEIRKLAPLTNRAIAGLYPPGSTLKQFDASIALQADVIEPDTLVRDPGRLVVEDQYVEGVRYVYPNSTPRDNGQITVSDALMVSSNVFFMSIVGGNKDGVVNLEPEDQTIERGLGITRLADGLAWFGFGQPTGIELAGERAGQVPTPAWKQQVFRAPWTTGDTYNVAIGQGNMLVTPLQLLMATTAVANNGTLYRPQIVQAVVSADGSMVEQVAPEIARQVPVDPAYFDVVREGMRRSVTEGINVAARDDCSGLAIAGKTGTAEFGPVITIPTDDGRGTREVRQSHSWFVGFAPYDDPEIAVLVLSEGTGDLNNGSATITVPAVTQIMQAYFGVTPPDPLPNTCQQDLPPLPPRSLPEQVRPVGAPTNVY